MILHMVRQWLRQNLHLRLYSQKRPDILHSRVNYGLYFLRIWVKIDHIISALHVWPPLVELTHSGLVMPYDTIHLSEHRFVMAFCLLSPRPAVANSCMNQCEWHRLRMESDFFLQNLGFIPGIPLCRTRTIWYDDYLLINANQTRIKHELIRCSEMQ